MYRLIISRRAHRNHNRLPKHDYDAVKAAIEKLVNNPWAHGVVKIKGKEDTWRIRQGDYRIVYSIDVAQKTITVLDIDHRKQVYRWS